MSGSTTNTATATTPDTGSHGGNHAGRFATVILEETTQLFLGCVIPPIRRTHHHGSSLAVPQTQGQSQPQGLGQGHGHWDDNDIIPGTVQPGIVSDRFRCQQKGSFFYDNHIDSKSDASSLNYDSFKLTANLDAVALLAIFVLQPAPPTTSVGLSAPSAQPALSPLGLSTFAAIKNLTGINLNAQAISNSLVGQTPGQNTLPSDTVQHLSPLLDRFNIPYTSNNGIFNITPTDLSALGLVLGLFVHLGISSTSLDVSDRERSGEVTQEVKISWDFSNCSKMFGFDDDHHHHHHKSTTAQAP